MIISRRSALVGIGSAAVFPKAALAETLRPTPQETMGPFFPLRPPPEADADLTSLAGRSGRARGQLVELKGKVLRRDGSPVAGATVALWQANAAGRYAHPSDPNTAAPLDPGFQGFGQIRTGSDGQFRFITVKPGPYPTQDGGMRAPHIHFMVDGAEYRLVTQMYFPNEPLNERDFLRSTMASRRFDPALLTARHDDSFVDGAKAFAWDIVLQEPAR